MKILKYYDDAFAAYADREFLASEGIPAEVLNENIGGMLPYSIPSLRPCIAVGDECWEQAAEILSVNSGGQTACPECGSGDIAYRLPARYRGLTRAVIAAAAFFGLPLGNIKRINHCNGCHHEFRP